MMRYLALIASLLVVTQAHAQGTSAPTATGVPTTGLNVTVNWNDFKDNFCVYGSAIYSLNSLICIGTQAKTCEKLESDKIAQWKSTGTCR